ncbi:hypothetical protein GIB67_022654 [Kingdonia uniflora]|uniref:Uncharacterized protein n=1 Tax=Kingdonia uniflora TaxID=39325 RepID=A0A7J7P8P7_9MAGN|nr:hypothetical protein GIB67_022654 [Kingdonia uniflora]
MEGEGPREVETDHPCNLVVQAVNAILKCLGFDSMPSSGNMENPIPKQGQQGRDIASSITTTTTIAALVRRRPQRPGVSSGNPGQNN